MNKTLWTHRVVTGLFTAFLGMGVVTYFAQHEVVAEMFTRLGFPTWLIYPLAIAKALGLVALWSKRSRVLTELAYAGFGLDLILAVSAHIMAGDGQFVPPLVALVLLITSYVARRRVAAGATASTTTASDAASAPAAA